MNPFEPGGGVIPPAPIDIPSPDIPAANFTAIGKQIADGVATGGFWDGFFKGFFNNLIEGISRVVGGLLNLVELVFAKLLFILFKILQQAEGGSDQMAAAVLSGMTGLSVGASTFTNATNRSAREDVAASLIGIFQTALSKGAATDADGALKPGSAGAEEFLKIVAHMGIEGWLIGWIAEAVGGERLEQLGSLKEVIEQGLGLGRLARRALAAPMKILVEEPYTWKLNAQYRPTKLAVAEYIREYLRGEFDRSTLDAKCSLLGHTSANVTALINSTRTHLNVGQIEMLLLHGSITDADSQGMLKAQGYDAATGALALQASNLARVDGWQRQYVNEALVSLERRWIAMDEFLTILNGTGMPESEKSIIKLLANQKVTNSQHRLSLAQGEQLVENSLWAFDKFRTLTTNLGYSLSDETDLEHLLLLKAKKATDAQHAKQIAADARAAAAAARAADAQLKLQNAPQIAEAHGVSIARYESLVIDGLRTIAQYRAFLVGKGIAADNIDALATVLQARLDKAAHGTAQLPGLTATAKAKALDLAQLERAVLAGHISRNEYASRVTATGFDAADVQILVELLDDRIAAAAAKGSAKTGAAATLKARGISLANEERAVRMGFQTIAQYGAFLDSHGFPPEDRDILVHLMQAQLVSDDQARAVRGEVAGQMQARGLSLRELEQAVRAGVKTRAEYQLALQKAGYDSATQEALTDLLDLHMLQDEHSLAIHGSAAALFGQQGLSIAEVESAVKQGALTLADYADQLERAGLAPADVETLRLTLAAKFKLDPKAPA